MNAGAFNMQRFISLDDINRDNVDQLGLDWEFDDFVVRGRTHRGMESNPIVLDGVMYMTGPWNVVYALDAVTGKLLWKYEPNVDGSYARNACCDVVNRGLAVLDGKIYIATLDGWLVAISQKTGEFLWKKDTFYERDKWDYSITGAPYVAGDKILVGNAGADMGARGYVSAYDANDGSLAWRFWVVPGDPEIEPDETPDVTMARKTWPGDSYWELGLGGNAWDSMAYDPETNIAYIGTGNGSPHPQWARSKNGGSGYDNLFLSSIVAVDANTGRRLWHYQTTPGDSWDYTATSPLVFADIEIDGKMRKVIMQTPKNGFFYVLDRQTGDLLRADAFANVTWTSGIDLKTGRPAYSESSDYSKSAKIVWPSLAGAHAWSPISFSPRTGLMYLSVTESPARYEMNETKTEYLDGTHFHTREQFPPFNNPGDEELLKGKPDPTPYANLKAWDPVAGRAAWVSAELPFLSGGTLVTGDLLFHGASDGYLRVYDALNGEVLKELNIGTSMMSAPISYKIDGVQYVAVTAGAGGPRGSSFSPNEAAGIYENYERLLVFKLNNKEVILPPKRVALVLPAMPEKIEASAETLESGEHLFALHCQRCHRMGGAVANYPNLWSLNSGTIAAFEAIVGQGAMEYSGMANFSDVLSPEDIAAIKAFIVNDTIVKRTESTKAGASSNTAYH